MTKIARVIPVFGSVSSSVPMPERNTRRGSRTIYPFDSLTKVGDSFPVMNKTAAQIASVISAHNRKHATETFDPATQEKSKKVAKHFFAHDVDPKTDPDKAKCRVWRDI